jgi:hypothetical protein
MKTVVLGALAGAALMFLAAGLLDRGSSAYAQRAAPYAQAGADGGLMAIPSGIGEGGQLITVIDARARALGVYRVAADGKIKLLSVRNIQWDLQVMQLNSDIPLPLEIKTLVEQKQ